MNVTLFRDLPTENWPSMERYADELAAALGQLGCRARPFVVHRPFPHLGGSAGTLLNYVWRSTAYPLAARARQGDVNHIVDHSYAHLIHILDARRTVVTCHDLAPLTLNQRGRGLSRRLWARSFRAMLRASRIITDSAFTRDEILRHSWYPADRIHIVPLGVATSFFEPAPEEDLVRLRTRYELLDRRVLLHIGSCQPRKNVEAILNALADLRDLDPVFVQVGGQFSPAQLSRIRAGTAHVIQIPRATERELRAWYRLASIFVLPSIYEGFGLPILEAMASGTPVICARAASLPEVAGDAAVLIDPRDPATLSAALRTALTDPYWAAPLRARGIERARQFRWEHTARLTLDVYEQTQKASTRRAA